MKHSTWLKRLFLLIMTIFLSCFFQWLGSSSIQALDKFHSSFSAKKISKLDDLNRLGLGYLHPTSIYVASTSTELMDSIIRAEEKISVMPEDIPVKFLLGTNRPIRNNEETESDNENKIEAIGFLNNSGEAEKFTPLSISRMFANERSNNGQISGDFDAEYLLADDASNDFKQFRRIPKLDLVAQDKTTGDMININHVSANAVCRDALNAVLNNNLERLEDS